MKTKTNVKAGPHFITWDYKHYNHNETMVRDRTRSLNVKTGVKAGPRGGDLGSDWIVNHNETMVRDRTRSASLVARRSQYTNLSSFCGGKKMKTCSLLILTIAVLLFTGCTDRLAGPDLDTQPEAIPGWESNASKASAGALADLSLRMTVDNATPSVEDSLYFVVEVYNEGPDRATGVEVRFTCGCMMDDDGPYGLVYQTSTGGYNDSLGVWIVGSMPAGATERLLLAGHVIGAGTFISTAEIIASDVRDPDSVPGDGDPRQDDYDSVTIVVGSGPS